MLGQEVRPADRDLTQLGRSSMFFSRQLAEPGVAGCCPGERRDDQPVSGSGGHEHEPRR